MPKKINLTNQKFGHWNVLREATQEEKQNRPGTYWICKCDCGTEKIVNGQLLREGKSKSCGCQTKELLSINHKSKNVKDISGQIFGQLTVIERDFSEEKKHNSHNTYWKCKCSCGNEISVVRSSLTSGKTKSCGCLRKEKAAEHLKQISSNNFINETGNKYGKLTVLYKVPNTKTGGTKWHCKCECGNEIDVLGNSLRTGNTKSCGCIGKSAGEWKIETLLAQKNINFSREYRQIINGKKLRYDFAIFDNQQKLKYLIEFDGKQHLNSSDFFGGQEYLKYIQEHDIIKNEWCKDNNIPLIRIPYAHLESLCIEDLLLETSQFIIN